MSTATLTQISHKQRANRLTAEERKILTPAPAQRISVPLEVVPAYLRAEWEHFKGYGWSDHRTADRLGIQRDTVNKWVSRHAQRIARDEELARQQRDAENDALAAQSAAFGPAALIGAGPTLSAHLPATAQAIAC